MHEVPRRRSNPVFDEINIIVLRKRYINTPDPKTPTAASLVHLDVDGQWPQL